MSDKSSLNVSGNVNLGKIEIAPEVIEVIAGIAALEVSGIASMRGTFATGMVERFGGTSHSKGVKVELSEEGILIDLYVILESGVSIPKVAESVQKNIRLALMTMTALEIKEVNIHVVGIQMEQDYDGNMN